MKLSGVVHAWLVANLHLTGFSASPCERDRVSQGLRVAAQAARGDDLDAFSTAAPSN